MEWNPDDSKQDGVNKKEGHLRIISNIMTNFCYSLEW
jgi:hypothetical protein